MNRSQRLLAGGADVHFCDPSKETPLLSACRGDHSIIVKLLSSYGSNYDARDAEGCTPLIICAKMEHIASARILLKFNLDIEARDDTHLTAILHACHHDDTEVLRLSPIFSHASSRWSTCYSLTKPTQKRETETETLVCSSLVKRRGETS